MGGQLGLPGPAGDGCNDNGGGAESVSYIVLYNQNGARSSLLRADDRIEVGVIQIAPLQFSFHKMTSKNK